MGFPIRDIVGGFGADLAVVVTRPGQRQASLWIIWASFGGSSESDGHAEAESLAKLSTLIREVAKEHPNLRAIRGVLVTGSLRRPLKSGTSDVNLLSAAKNHLSWKEQEFPETRQLLRKLIQADVW